VLVRRSLAPLLAASLLAFVVAGPGSSHAADGVTTLGSGVKIVSDAAGATAWKLDAPVKVSVTDGTLTSVSLTRRDGRAVRGVQKPTRWSSTGKLVPRTTYVLDATAVAADGTQAVLHDTVRTGAPPKVLRATVSPNGRTVGVGRPLVVTFNYPVRRKAAVESALHVTASRDIGAASWSWTSSRTVQYRPKRFWPARTSVSVTADLRKVQAGPGLWGMQD
jgi:hypothetical protein